MRKKRKQVSADEHWLVVERLKRFLEANKMRSGDFARKAGMLASEVSSFKTGERVGKKPMNEITKGLDTLGAPAFEPPVQGFPMLYDLVPTMRSVVESGKVAECTLPELLFMTTLMDRATFDARDIARKHEIRFADYVDRNFDLMPLMQVIVGSAGVEECTVADLLRYLFAGKQPPSP